MYFPASQITLEESLSLDGPPDAEVVIGGQVYQYHLGSGYYALQARPEVLAAACDATLQYGISSGAGRAAFIAPPIFEVERKTAQALGTENAIYCESRHLANQILFDTIQGTFDRVFLDEAAHGSLRDAIKILRGIAATPVLFAHRDANDLKTQLDKTLRPHERPLVVTDGVFFTNGEIAPLAEYDALLADYADAAVLLDDSHGFAVLGQNAKGTLEHYDYEPSRANRTILEAPEPLGQSGEERTFFTNPKAIAPQTPVRYYFSMALSKAIGGSGAVLPGSEMFVQRILERSRSIYESSLPPTPIAAATVKGLELVFQRNEIRDTLKANTQSLKRNLRKLGITTNETPVPVITFQLGSAHNMRRIQRAIAQERILVSYIPRSPGIGPDGLLHISVFATHTSEQLEHLVDTISRIV